VNLSEKETCGLMDQIKDDELFNLLEDIPGEFPNTVPGPRQNSIKNRTFEKLAIDPLPKKNRWKLWQPLVASFLVIILVTAAAGPEAVWAKLQKALQYVPGMNIVLEDNEQEIERYVLSQPIEKKLGNGTIRIEGVILDENNALIQMSAKNLPQYDWKKLYFRNAKGKRYYINGYGAGGGTDVWHGTFHHLGLIEDRTGLQIVLPDEGDTSIGLPLVKAKRYASYEEMGPTVTVNGISITAIAAREKGKTRINLISPPVDGMRVESYGTNPLSGQVEITLKDTAGAAAIIWLMIVVIWVL